MKSLLLASTSRYRAEVLGRLNIAFDVAPPNCDETPEPNESANELVQRLSVLKAASLRDSHPYSLIIGSDQVAERDGQILGKPHDHKNAVDQLQAASGRTVLFHTGVCLLNAQTGTHQVAVATTQVKFRAINREEIERYLHAEKPYDCAGSFKSEGLGITLFQAVIGDDPVALIGLPLIKLVSMLRNEGVWLP